MMDMFQPAKDEWKIFTKKNHQVSQNTKDNSSLSGNYDLTSQIAISRFPDKPESKTKS